MVRLTNSNQSILLPTYRSAFGADQFQLPEQEVQLASFFAIFYFAINSGSLISTVLTPILREDVQCFGDDHCYPLAFAIPAALMIFALGKRTSLSLK